MFCVFCKIISGEFSSYKLYEDDKVLAILDISQATIGHTLVIPKNHYENIFDIPSEDYLHLQGVVKELASKIKDKLGCEGINILNNNGTEAGQTVMHYHVHIIPRYKDDDLTISSVDHSKEVDLAKIQQQILN